MITQKSTISRRWNWFLAAALLCGACSEPAPITTPDLSGQTDDLAANVDLAPTPDLTTPPDLAPPPSRFAKVVPWRAVNLVGPTDKIWEEYDYRPQSQGGHREEIDAQLAKLKAVGVRQVQIQTMFAWSVETNLAPTTKTQSVVFYNPTYQVGNPATWGKVPRTRRGDMGLTPYIQEQVPAHWDVPTPLRTPEEITQKAEQILGDLLDAVSRAGLTPVLKSELYLVLAEVGNDFSGDFNYTDPSRNYDVFYTKYQQHLVRMTQLAAKHNAAMMILGTETPYVAGAGLSTFADGSLMSTRRDLIGVKWRTLIAAVKKAASDAGRPDLLFSYTEINPFWEGHYATGEKPVPVWSRVPFWDELDVVGINFYLPGRWTDGAGNYDTAPRTADEMVTYGETHDFVSDTIPNLTDLKNFFVTQKGYRLDKKPVIFAEDGCTSSKLAAANPAAPPFLVARTQPDFTEQKNLFEAHFKLLEKHGGGWLAGLGFWQVTPTTRWGGAWNPANTANYANPAAYFNFLGTPTEEVVKTYFSKPY